MLLVDSRACSCSSSVRLSLPAPGQLCVTVGSGRCGEVSQSSHRSSSVELTSRMGRGGTTVVEVGEVGEVRGSGGGGKAVLPAVL